MKRRDRGQIIVRSADAGALAGASYFKETGYWSSNHVNGPSETNSIVGRFMTVGGPGTGGGPDPGDTGPHDLGIRLVE